MANGSQQQSTAQALIPFTGYYTLDAATGSFVMVETKSNWQAGEGTGGPSIQYEATITISPDGQTSEEYLVEPSWPFEGGRLWIPAPEGQSIADLTFSDAGGMASLQGTIGVVPVAGTTPFGPVQLSIWAGTYYQQNPAPPGGPYTYAAVLQIGADGVVQFAADGGALEPVPSYTYVYGMFVIAFPAPPQVPTHILEMGTATGWGRVAGNASDGSMLVSIQLQQPGPHL